MRSITKIKDEIALLKAKAKQATDIGKVMSSPGSAGFIKLLEVTREAAQATLNALNPLSPTIAIEYAAHKKLMETYDTLIEGLTSFKSLLKKYEKQALDLNGELQEAIKAGAERERNRI